MRTRRQASLSSRRAWIEISLPADQREVRPVALLAEGVDRNQLIAHLIAVEQVALLAEGVDRNRFTAVPLTEPARSLSSRRAWIEMVIKKPGQNTG